MDEEPLVESELTDGRSKNHVLHVDLRSGETLGVQDPVFQHQGSLFKATLWRHLWDVWCYYSGQTDSLNLSLQADEGMLLPPSCFAITSLQRSRRLRHT